MGYHTDFSGTLQFNREVTPQMKEYINRFSSTRRMPRDNEAIKKIYPNWKELCFFGELGEKGEYFAPMSSNFGQDEDFSIIDYNAFDLRVQPGLWCQWIINDDDELEWDGNEKFYNYVEWLEYMIKHFFAPLGYVLSGEIEFQGEEMDDRGEIIVEDNKVRVRSYDDETLEDYSDNDLIEEIKKRGYDIAG